MQKYRCLYALHAERNRTRVTLLSLLMMVVSFSHISIAQQTVGEEVFIEFESTHTYKTSTKRTACFGSIKPTLKIAIPASKWTASAVE